MEAKHAGILDLPLELRDKILLYAMNFSSEEDLYTFENIYFPSKEKQQRRAALRTRTKPTHKIINLFYVNHQFHAEAEEAFYKTNDFRFTYPLACLWFLEYLKSRNLNHKIEGLEIKISFIKDRLEWTRRFPEKFKLVRNLKRLKINFKFLDENYDEILEVGRALNSATRDLRLRKVKVEGVYDLEEEREMESVILGRT